MNKYKEAYALISTSISEELSLHIISITYSWGSLKMLKYLYDSDWKLELIHFLCKLFNLDLKDNYPMDLVFEIKSILHNVDATSVKIDISLMTFIKSLYPT